MTHSPQYQLALLETLLRGTGVELTVHQAHRTYGVRRLRRRIKTMRAAGLIVRERVNTNGVTYYSISRRDAAGCQSKVFSCK